MSIATTGIATQVYATTDTAAATDARLEVDKEDGHVVVHEFVNGAGSVRSSYLTQAEAVAFARGLLGAAA